jgi:hypothetical protein
VEVLEQSGLLDKDIMVALVTVVTIVAVVAEELGPLALTLQERQPEQEVSVYFLVLQVHLHITVEEVEEDQVPLMEQLIQRVVLAAAELD